MKKIKIFNMKNMRSIKVKILIVALSIFITSISLTTAVGTFLSYSSTIATLEATMSELAVTASKQIENRLDKSRSIVSELGMIARLSNPELSVSEKKEILATRIEKYKLVSLNVTDMNGIDLDGNDVLNEEFFKNAIKGQPYVSNLAPVEGKNMTILTISAPLWEKGIPNTKIVGIVYAQVNGDFLSKITNNITIGKTGSAFMLDQEGFMIANKDYDLVVNRDNLLKSSQANDSLKSLTTLEKNMILGKVGFGECFYNGVNKFICYAPVNNTNGWSVAINVDKNEFVSSTYKTIYISLALSIILLIIAVFIFIRFANSLTKPIKEIESAAIELSKGNLDIQIEHSGNDELGNLSNSFNLTIHRLSACINDISRCCSQIAKGNFSVTPEEEFSGHFIAIEHSINDITDSLSTAMEQINISAEQVFIGTNEVSAGAQTLAQGATEQAGSIEQLFASITEIDHKSKTNAESANAVNMQAISVGEEISFSNSKMGQMLKSMSEINHSSNLIVNIIKTIEEIAFQTNILALNAAVEAARAGAAGKGFAVVADEIRNLAIKSAEAATETTNLIQTTIQTVQDGTIIADETASSLVKVVTEASEINALISRISTSSMEQATLIGEVIQCVEQISVVVQNNASVAEQSSATSEELNSQAEALQHLIGQFKMKAKLF